MTILLKIEKHERNEKYKEEMKEHQNPYSGSIDSNRPQRYFVTEVLSVEVTEKQFEAIRKEVLKVF